jgi:Tat protein secretion system quality control protein TatD with DNase activity
MRAAFRAQLALAAELRRPAVLHGAKCWGEVVKEVEDCSSGRAPAYIFHGFSRSAGLLPRIFALNGFVSVGPAVLNDHAVNYRELVKAIPADRLLAETDRTSPDEAGPGVGEVVAAIARLRGVAADALAAQLDANAAALEGCFRRPA